MKFENDKQLLNYLQHDGDLYSAEIGIYAFCYNNRGAIAYYYISEKEASKLADQAREFNEYWGAFLGVGGWIIEPDDDNYEWFDNPKHTDMEDWSKYEWEDTETVYVDVFDE